MLFVGFVCLFFVCLFVCLFVCGGFFFVFLFFVIVVVFLVDINHVSNFQSKETIKKSFQTE